MTSKQLQSLLKTKKPVLFVGAGISISPPAGLPDWHGLRDWTLGAIADQYDYLKQYLPNLTELEMLDAPSKRGMTPEVVASTVSSSVPSYFDSFRLLEAGQPNSNHHLVALLAKAGKVQFVVTTNWDRFIELALEHHNISYTSYRSATEFRMFRLLDDPSDSIHILKLHGCISLPETITATVEQEARGLYYQQRAVIMWLLQRHPFIFWGYSGWDLKINLDYYGMQTLAPDAPGFYWSFFKNETYSEPFNPYVEQLAELYGERARLGHMLMPEAAEKLLGIAPEDVPGYQLVTPQQLAIWIEEKTQQFRSDLQEWAAEHVTPLRATEVFAKLLFHSGFSQRSIACYEKLAELGQNESNYNAVIGAYQGLASCYHNVGDYTRALQVCSHAEQLALSHQDIYRLHQIRAAIGNIHRNRGETEAAASYYEAALKMAEDLHIEPMAASLYSQLADINIQRGQIELALKLIEKTQAICLRLGDRSWLQTVYRIKGIIYRSWGESDKALKYYEEGEALARMLGDPAGVMEFRYYCATIYATNDASAARDILLDVVNYARANQRDILLSNSLKFLNMVELNLGNKEQAHRITQEAIELARKQQNWQILSDNLRHLANYVVDKNPQLALSYLNESLSITHSLKNPLPIAIILTEIGEVFEKHLQDKETAINHYIKSISFYRAVDMELEHLVVDMLGRIHACDGQQRPSAATIIQQALDEVPYLELAVQQITKKESLDLDLNDLDDFVEQLASKTEYPPYTQYASPRLTAVVQFMSNALTCGTDLIQGNSPTMAGVQQSNSIFRILQSIANGERYSQLAIQAEGYLGWTTLLLGDETEGMERIENARQQAEFHEDYFLATQLLSFIGYAHGMSNNQEQAIAVLDQALNIAQEHRLQNLEHQIVKELGTWLKQRGEWMAALKYLEQAASLAERQGDLYVRANMLFDIGKAHRELEDYKASLRYREQAFQLLTASNAQPLELAVRLATIGALYENNLGKPERAVELYEQAAGYYFLGNTNVEHNLSEMYRIRERALELVDDPASIEYPVFDRLCDLAGEETAIKLLTIAANSVAFPEQLFSPRPFSRVVQMTRGSVAKSVGGTFEAAARLMNDRGNTEQALDWLEKATSIANLINDYVWMLDLMCQRGSVLYHQERYEEALDIYQEGEKIGLLTQGGVPLIQLYHELGTVQIELENYEGANIALTRALKLSQNAELVLEQAQSHGFLNVLAMKQADGDAILEHIRAAARLFDQAGKAEEALLFHVVTAERLVVRNMTEEAVYHIGRADSLQTDDTPQDIAQRLQSLRGD